MRLLEKLPVPLPSLVCESVIVGIGEVLQYTPRVFTFEPPLLVMFPPHVALVGAMSVTLFVVTVGKY